MADVQVPNASGSSSRPPRTGKSRITTTTVTPKLRDCCLGCASSKVRCPREKPACSRCVKRKIACEYLASRRAGHRHDAFDGHASRCSSAGSVIDLDLNDTANLNAASPATPVSAVPVPDAASTLLAALSSGFAPNVTTTTAVTNSLDASFLQSPQGLPRDASSELTLSANASQPSPSLLWPDVHESDDFQAFTMPSFTAEGPDADIVFSDAFDFGSSINDGISSALALSPGALRKEDFANLINPNFIAPSSESPSKKPTRPVSSGCDQVTTDSHCSCLVQALKLMRKLFPHPSTFCTTSGTKGGDDLLPTVSVVIERNRNTVEAISAMLACPCSQDAHLLAVMAHIVFKVLGWYAVAARRTTPPTPTTSVSKEDDSSSSSGAKTGSRSSESSSTMRSPTETSSSYLEQVCWQADRVGCYHLDGDDSGRMAAQLVLSELHRVQSLVRVLAAKLEGQAAAQRSTEPPSVSVSKRTEQPLLPFSGAILDLLGVDLRKWLKELSVELVKSLRM